MSDLISVIIPVYKVEAYLIDCVESVLCQTYQNLEIILVDDGSPDNCPKMCDEFAAQDSRIRVIHKENGGLSSARNAGLDAAGGEFVTFLDSDDCWSPAFLEHLYRAIAVTGADFAVCRMHRFAETAEFPIPEPAVPEYLSRDAAWECLFGIRNENMVVAPNKLYRRKLFESLRYPVGQLHEDEAVIHHLLGAADGAAWIDEELYYYRQTPGSITSAKFNIRRLDETKAKEDRIAYFESIGRADLADRTRVVYLSNLMRLHRTVRYELEDKKTAKKVCAKLHKRFSEIFRKDLVRGHSFIFLMKCYGFRTFPKLYSLLEYNYLKGKLNMIKRIFRKIKRILKRQSADELKKEWLIQHGMRIGEKVDNFSWGGMDFQYPGLITIGNEVTIASGCRILAHDASVGYLTRSTRVGVVEIGDHCFIGAETVILPNVRIGDWSIIGAGSVVTKDIPANCVAAGNPAKIICTTEEFKAKHEMGLHSHYVSKKPWREWADATQEEWAELREKCKDTYAYITRREDI